MRYSTEHKISCDVLMDFRVVSAQSWQLFFGGRWSLAGDLFHLNDNHEWTEGSMRKVKCICHLLVIKYANR
jgi:hypothetical protein